MKEALGDIKFKEVGKVVEGRLLGAARTGETEGYSGSRQCGEDEGFTSSTHACLHLWPNNLMTTHYQNLLGFPKIRASL